MAFIVLSFSSQLASSLSPWLFYFSHGPDCSLWSLTHWVSYLSWLLLAEPVLWALKPDRQRERQLETEQLQKTRPKAAGDQTSQHQPQVGDRGWADPIPWRSCDCSVQSQGLQSISQPVEQCMAAINYFIVHGEGSDFHTWGPILIASCSLG